MSRTGRNNVEHDSAKLRSAVSNIPEGVAKALERVKESNEKEEEAQDSKPIPKGIKDLILFGKITQDLTIGNYTFKISTLNAKQQRDILKRLFPLSNEDKVTNLKILTLSESLISINGTPLEEMYYGDNLSLSPQEKRFEILLELQFTVVDRLYTTYEELAKKSNSLSEPGGLEESLKN